MRQCIYRLGNWFPHTSIQMPKIEILMYMLAWACDRPMKWCQKVQSWSWGMLKVCHEAMHLQLKSDHEIHPNGTLKKSHAKVIQTLAKWSNFGHFGKVRSRETTFILTIFHLMLGSWWILRWKFGKSNIIENFLPSQMFTSSTLNNFLYGLQIRNLPS